MKTVHTRNQAHVAEPCERPTPQSAFIEILPFGRHAGGFRKVTLVDRSNSGVGFLSDQPMSSGEQFLVNVSQDSLQMQLYTVKHCLRFGDQFKIGAQFEELLGDSD